MSEYWKSIPKIYCKFCNVWYQDNKSSRDFHERSFKHKNNLSRHISDVQKRSREREKEEDAFKIEMQRIERAAMVAYEKDMINSGQPLPSSSSSLPKATTSAESKEETTKSRFEQPQPQMSNDLIRREALEIVSNKLKKKHEWYESKTVEGKVYYYNRVTMETKWKEPKGGFVSIEDQKEMNLTDVPGDQSRAQDEDGKLFRHEQFRSTWSEVASNDVKIDLDLPKPKMKRKPDSADLIGDLNEPEQLEIKEKVIDSGVMFKSKKKKDDGAFKKRKLNSNQSRRTKTDE